MRSITALTALLFLALLLQQTNATDTTKTFAGRAAEKQHEQKRCPVMGGKINKKYYTDIQGQRVYHCCPRCSSLLKADPDTYFKKAAAEGVVFENVQRVCPISGEKISKNTYTDYQGRRIYFCCGACQQKFAADPVKYLKRMDEPADSVRYDNDMQMD